MTSPDIITIDRSAEPTVDACAKAVFGHVFAGIKRLDGMHVWEDADQRIQAGFRAEVRVCLAALAPSVPPVEPEPTLWLVTFEEIASTIVEWVKREDQFRNRDRMERYVAAKRQAFTCCRNIVVTPLYTAPPSVSALQAEVERLTAQFTDTVERQADDTIVIKAALDAAKADAERMRVLLNEVAEECNIIRLAISNTFPATSAALRNQVDAIRAALTVPKEQDDAE